MRLNAKCRRCAYHLQCADVFHRVVLGGVEICLSLFLFGLLAQQRPDITAGQIQSSGATAGEKWPEMIEQGGIPPSDETTAILSFGLIALGMLLWGALRWYQGTPQARQQHRQQILLRMAALDDRYARGEISKQRYQQTRQRLKQRAIRLTMIASKND